MQERDECPVCLEERTQSQLRSSFTCTHEVCTSCDNQLLRRRQHRCPVCRQPRLGMSREEAEPPPEMQMMPDNVAFWTNNLRTLAQSRGASHLMFFRREPAVAVPRTTEGTDREVGVLYEVNHSGAARSARAARASRVSRPTDEAPNEAPDESGLSQSGLSQSGLPGPDLPLMMLSVEQASGPELAVVDAADRAASLLRDLVGALRNADRVDLAGFRLARERHGV